MNWPQPVGTTLLARREWSFPELRGIVEVPILRRDGSVCFKPGYDERTKLLVAIPEQWPCLMKTPGRRDAEAALQLLKDLLRTFPFCSDADLSVVLSGMLTAVVRPRLGTAPMHAISAPTPGSGKSMLADMIAILGMGRRNAMLGWADGSVESEKRLSAALMLGDPILCFDNVERPLGGELLCMALTQRFVRVRVLGFSKVVELPMTATMLATGNNLVVSGDAKRRILVAALDAKHERPELRKFTNDPVRDVLDNRKELVNACLTILMAYLRAKNRPVAPKLGSYELWSKLVRSALLWLDQADPVDVMERTYENDQERAELRGLMEVWSELFGSTPTTAAEVIRKAGDQHGGSDRRLYDAVEVVATAANGKLSPKKLGTYLAAHANVRVGKRRFVPDVSKDRTGSKRWRLRTEK